MYKRISRHKESKRSRERNKQGGFTFIEILFVIAIIGTLAVVLLPHGKAGKNQAKILGIQQNQRVVEGFIQMCRGTESDLEGKLIASVELQSLFNPVHRTQKGVGVWTDRESKCVVVCKGKTELKDLTVGQVGVYNRQVYLGTQALTDTEKEIAVALGDVSKINEGTSTPTVSYEEKEVTEYIEQGDTNFNKSLDYNKEGFIGTLHLTGTPKEIGNYKGEDKKTVTDSKTSSNNSFAESIGYNSEGYSGTLTKSGSSMVVSGTLTNGHNESSQVWVGEDSKTVTEYRSVTAPSGTDVYSWSYSAGGYTGNLSTSSSWIRKLAMSTGTFSVPYTGTVTRPAHYETTSHWVSGSDTRVWKQNYSGTVTKPSSGSHKYKQKYVGTVKRLKK